MIAELLFMVLIGTKVACHAARERPGRTTVPLQRLNAMLARNPRWWDGYLLRASIHAQQGRYDAAVADLAQLVDSPQKAQGLALRAWVYLSQGEWSEALQTAEQSIELKPRLPDGVLYRLYANLALHRGRAMADDARIYLEERGWHDSLSGFVVLVAYFGYVLTYQEAEGRSFLQQALEHLDDRWPRPLLAALLAETPEAALASATTPDQNSDVHITLGLREAYAGRPTRAIPHLQWVQEQPHDRRYSRRLAESEFKHLLERID
ncbi:MAG: hypothetical protein ACYCW6_25925 [Candidatus Xenobia bacterium]